MSRPGSLEGAPMRAADVASRDGRGGASELGPQAAGTARAGVGTGDSAGVAVRQRGLGSGRVRESEKGREGPYVRHDLAPITTAPSSTPRSTVLSSRVRIYGAKLPAKSPPYLRQAQDLGAKIYGTERCKLGAINNGAELRVQILKSYL